MDEEKRKNGFIGVLSNDSYGISGCVITKVETQLGYLQVIEYTLQDWSYLHVVQWHFNNDLDKESLIPKVNYESFYKEKDAALKLAYKVSKLLLQQFGYEKEG